MSLAPFDVYCAEASNQSQVRRWVLLAIVLSLLLHAVLVAVFHRTRLENFRHAVDVPSVAPAMTLWRLVDLPAVNESEARFVPEEDPAPVPVAPVPIPVEAPNFEVPGILPMPAEFVPQALPHETPPGLGGIDVGGGANAQAALENELRGLADAFMGKGERVGSDLAAPSSPETIDLKGGESPAAGLPDPQTLDKFLQSTGPLPAGGAKIDVPGGALFEYDSAELRPQAVGQLGQLGEFIRSHPDATVSIEGHSDAIGAPEYNQLLSEKRAESVRLWLVQQMGISPERIQTRGFGSTRLRVSADGTIDEQQPNRRVEIVIKANR